MVYHWHSSFNVSRNALIVRASANMWSMSCITSSVCNNLLATKRKVMSTASIQDGSSCYDCMPSLTNMQVRHNVTIGHCATTILATRVREDESIQINTTLPKVYTIYKYTYGVRGVTDTADSHDNALTRM